MSNSEPVWFVTGASKGIGLETARAALDAGARLVATSRDADRLRSQIGAPEDRFLAVSMSLTDPADISRAVSTAVEAFGRIDVLVNNAGYSMLGAVEEFNRDEIRQNFDVNVFGLLEVTQQVLPHMRRQGSGHVINIASISADVTGPATGLYSATKAAVLMLTEALAAETAPLGIHATAVCPGGVRTDFLDSSSSRQPAEEIAEYAIVRTALHRYAELNHQQGGDPRLVAQALITLSQMQQPPTRLYLGKDALYAIDHKARSVLDDARRHQALSASIDR
ncbi:SDR family oxidoreductase [Nocardia sp. FBN12]|uniref:SDR family oxidoreductase n=1 Tax=Nocardia sp. FBN12 TaxID=3419766 RepID=UPI003D03E5FF